MKYVSEKIQEMQTQQQVKLPLHFSIRLSPRVILPVTVYDNHLCSFNDENKRKRKRTSSSQTSSQSSSSQNQTTNEKPVYQPWFTNDHLDELYKILKPFMYTCLFTQNDNTTNKKKKMSTSNSSENETEPQELELKVALQQQVSTDRNLQIVRGISLQFTYQFINTFESKYWLILPNPKRKRVNKTQEDPILIDDDEQDIPRDLDTMEHNLDIDSPPTQEHNLDIDSDNDPISQEEDQKPSPKKSKKQKEKQIETVTDTKDEDSDTRQQQQQDPYSSYYSWKYSLHLFVEPYSATDSQDVNPELISYYLKSK
jgi:hypothetical protein